MADPFRHEALLYAGDDELVAAVSAFVRDGPAAGEPALVLVGARKLDLLREELGVDAEGVQLGDIAGVGRNPARIIPAWQTFVARNAGPGVRLRGVGEPIFPERTAEELVEAHRHGAPQPRVPRHERVLARLPIRRGGARSRPAGAAPIDLVVGGEIARNSRRGSVFLWQEGRRVLCEIHGHGPLDGPLGDRELPREGSTRIGIWLANQLCDLVQVRGEPGGVTARLHLPVD